MSRSENLSQEKHYQKVRKEVEEIRNTLKYCLKKTEKLLDEIDLISPPNPPKRRNLREERIEHYMMMLSRKK